MSLKIFGVLALHFAIPLLLTFTGVESKSDSPSETQEQVSPSLQNNETVKKIQNYLGTLPLIRVAITYAPNNGHQSAGATLITRLRQLGYQGEIQVVYQAIEKEKLGYLIPPFNSAGSDNQSFPQEKLSFISTLSRQYSQLSHVPLAIMGADDSFLSPKEINADVLLTLQPTDWHVRPFVQIRENSRAFLMNFKNKAYIYQLPQPDQPSVFINAQMSHSPLLSHKVQGLQAIVESLNHAEMVPVYGHGIKNGTQAALFLAGIHSAIHQQPELFKGGVIVPVISELSSMEQRYLELLIRNILTLQTSVKTVQVTDPDIKSKCDNLRPGEILLVHVGAVSKPIFEYLYQVSTLPPVVEGRNSINLMQLIGKPYLPSSHHETFHFPMQHTSPNAASQIADLAALKLLDGYPSDIQTQLLLSDAQKAKQTKVFTLSAESIGQFILEAKNPQSQLNELFSEFQLSPHAIEKDQVVQGLAQVYDLQAKNTKTTFWASVIQRTAKALSQFKKQTAGSQQLPPTNSRDSNMLKRILQPRHRNADTYLDERVIPLSKYNSGKLSPNTSSCSKYFAK